MTEGDNVGECERDMEDLPTIEPVSSGPDDGGGVRVVYVAGYGRSGSTLLDTLLGSNPDVFGGGELCLLFDEVRQNNDCSCGMKLQSCDFWTEVLEEAFGAEWRNPSFLEHAAAVTHAVERLRPRFDRATALSEYGHLWRRVIMAIARVAGVTHIVDSSKTTLLTWGRLMRLTAMYPTNVIHLVRDPRAVMWSVGRGSNRLLEANLRVPKLGGPYRGLLGWILSNCLTELQLHRVAEPRILVRYEDMVSAPQHLLVQIQDVLALGLRSLNESNAGELAAGHGIAGNRMRRNGPIRVCADNEWLTALGPSARAAALITLPLMRRYGYGTRPH